MDDGGSARRDRWQLVGRHEELGRAVEALHDPERRGVVIHGPAGVGKSRLAAEVVARAEADGRAVIRARATSASASMPLGPLVHLLPPGVLGREDPVARYRDIVANLPRGDGRLVASIDDLHLLDDTSASLLAQLLGGGEAFLVGTVRSDVTPTPTVGSLWRRDDVARIDLGDLDADDVDALLHLVLGGPVHSDVVSAIWTASAGNVLLVRELVLAARANGDLQQRRGVWWLTGSLSTTPQLAEVVRERVRAVSEPARTALELLALWEPIGLVELESLVGAGEVEELDRAGLLDVGQDARRQPVRLAHPLHGEVIRAGLATLTRRRLLLDGAERIQAWGARRRGDQLAIAVARVDVAGTADPELLLAAARIARQAHDHRLVERLTRLDDRQIATAEHVLLRAESLHELGQFDEVERLLAETATTGDERIDVQLVALRVRNLMWGLQRPDDALAVNRAAREEAIDPDVVDELVTDEALTLLHSNRPDEALLALSAMSADPAPRSRVLRWIAEIPALLAVGQCDTALGMVDEAYAAHLALEDASVIAHPGVHVVHKLQGLLDAGRLTEATDLAERGYERAGRGGPPLGRTWFVLGLGRAALLAGRPRTAQRWLSEGAVLSMGTGFDGPHRLQLSLLATAQAWLGDSDGATASLVELDATPWSAFFEAEHDLGRGWAAVANGDPVRARDVLTAAAARAADAGQRASEAWLLHHVVRLGGAAGAAARLQVLAATCQGALVPAYADHARALVERDGDALDAVSARYADLGLLLVGAEAANAAADAHRRAQDQRRANASLVTSRALAAGCEGASTPGLVSSSALVPLTAREREIGTLAAAGLTSRDIAERMFLSKRTVENHLQNVYAKLGVRSRAELADGLYGAADVTADGSRP
ncbi:MAG: LuxR C-terminal-related transcriptional regulator [Ilumatobacteraceae bacterium]